MKENTVKDDSVSNMSPLVIDKVALGVRFEPQFQVIDRVGEIVDKILRETGTPFGPKAFPVVRSNPTERVLANEDTNDYIRLNTRDVILEMSVACRDLDRISKLAAEFEMYVLDKLRDVVGLNAIERYGVLFKLEECRTELAKTPVEHYLHQDFKNARSLALRFTRHLPSVEARTKKGVDDYRNVIYTIEQSDEGQVKISIDYQEYFKPSLNKAEWREKPYQKFVTRGIGYFENEFTSWVSNLLEDSEVA